MPRVIPHKILDPINPNIPNHSKSFQNSSMTNKKNFMFDNSTKKLKIPFLELNLTC